jgi:uncharacterized protein (DUF1501 family)
MVGPRAFTQVAFADAGYTGDVLVVLSLRGGFDGLNSIVPTGDPHYASARPNIGIPQGVLHQLDSTFGLHPALVPLLPYWQAGTLAAVHAVGQLDPTRSHFEAMEEMERAAPGSSIRSGWIDRMVGATGATNPLTGCAVGTSTPPASMSGPVPVTAVSSIGSFTLSGADNDAAELARWTKALKGLYAGAPAALATPAATTLSTVKTITTLAQNAYAPANGAHYPDSDTGRALADVANLIKAGLGLRVIAVDVDNWDMHVDMGSASSGWLHDNLTDLAGSLDAFATDLGTAGMAKVTLATLSEFGRRVEENGSGGVDHGHGNAVLLLGGGINGGTVYGTWPGLGPNALVDGDLAGTTDYRTILAEVLEKRCALSTGSVFPGLGSARLGVAS